MYGYGDVEGARLLARRNLEKLGNLDQYDYIVSDCGSCSGHLKEYADLLRDDATYSQAARQLVSKVRSFSELMGAIGVKAPLGELSATVTYHDPCHLGARYQGIVSQPRDLIGSIPGVEYRELPEADWCCGAAGTYNVMHNEISMTILERKAKNVEKSGADVLVTECPACIMQLSLGAKRRGLSTRVLSVSQLIQEAARAARPVSLIATSFVHLKSLDGGEYGRARVRQCGHHHRCRQRDRSRHRPGLRFEGATVVVADLDDLAGRATAATLAEQRRHRRLRADRCDESSVLRSGGRDRRRTVRPRRYLWSATPASTRRHCCTEMTESDWDRIFEINVKGMFFMITAVLPHMRQRQSGRIVLTSSVTGPVTGYPGWAHYGATKAAMLGFMRSAAIEVATEGVTINAVLPGNIMTEGMEGMGQDYINALAASIPMKRLGDAGGCRLRHALPGFERGEVHHWPDNRRRWWPAAAGRRGGGWMTRA